MAITGWLPWDSALVFLQMMIVSILSLNEAIKKVSALVIMNFQNSTETISVNLKNTGILLGQTPLNLLDGDNIPPVLSEDYHITLPPYGYMILGIQNEE